MLYRCVSTQFIVKLERVQFRINRRKELQHDNTVLFQTINNIVSGICHRLKNNSFHIELHQEFQVAVELVNVIITVKN